MNLTQDQLNVLEAVKLMLIENHPVLVVDGSAGTGKSTLIKEIITMRNSDEWKATLKLADIRPKDIVLTATTNKAVDSLRQATGASCKTIHAYLGLRMYKNSLIYPEVIALNMIRNTLLIIDEYSYIDKKLLEHIMERLAPDSSVIFVGDHAQLSPVGLSKIPVSSKGYPTIYLTQQVRQETSTLKDIAEDLKKYVVDGVFPELKPDGLSFIYYEDSDHELFSKAMVDAFKQGTCRFLSYTNERTLEVSKFLFEELENRTSYVEGDYVVNNKYFSGNSGSIRTDATVVLTKASKGTFTLNYTYDGNNFKDVVKGTYVDIKGMTGLFIPDDYRDHAKYAERVSSSTLLNSIQRSWVDFRPQYACTVHKSQGSTYDRVFIDLSDFSSIQDDKTLSRLLYVAMSRARKELHVIGHL